MKISVTLSFLSLLLLISSCNINEDKVDGNSTLQERQDFPFNKSTLGDATQLSSLRSKVSILIAKRQKSIQEDLSDLTYYYAMPHGTNRTGRPVAPQEFLGMWIKFENNYTFSYGKEKKLYGNGVYHYSPTDRILIMLDDNDQIEPKMWEFLFNSESFNFVGRPLIVIKDKKEQEFVLTSNFWNDAYLNNVETLLQVPNNSQILMNLSENKPVGQH